MTASDEARRRLAAGYLRGRTREEALAAWRADYDSPAYREGRPRLAWLGSVIRQLAAEAEVREDEATDHPKMQRRRR
jgi:hypothetical protein